MNAFKTSVSALALVALAAGGLGAATLGSAPVMAQASQSAPAPNAGPGKDWHHHLDAAARARFLEGRLAFFKTVLGITPAQETAWNGVADALRANAKDRMTRFQEMRSTMDKPKTAIDRLQMRIEFTKMAEANQERLLTAAKPLYDSLSPQQKQMADHLLARAGGHWRHMHGHGG
jgi:hypothetical protein